MNAIDPVLKRCPHCYGRCGLLMIDTKPGELSSCQRCFAFVRVPWDIKLEDVEDDVVCKDADWGDVLHLPAKERDVLVIIRAQHRYEARRALSWWRPKASQ